MTSAQKTLRADDMLTGLAHDANLAWRDLPKRSLLEIAATGGAVPVPRGKTLEAEIALVLSGVAAIEISLGDGRRALAEMFHEGDLIDRRRHDRTPQGDVIALTDIVVLAFDPAAFDGFIETHGDVARTFTHQMEDQTGRLRDHASDLSAKTPVERVASALFELSRWPGVRGEGLGELHMPILRKDLADYIGVKPETVSRSLRRLYTEGLIETDPLDNSAVRLVKQSQLRSVANGGAPRRSRGL